MAEYIPIFNLLEADQTHTALVLNLYRRADVLLDAVKHRQKFHKGSRKYRIASEDIHRHVAACRAMKAVMRQLVHVMKVQRSIEAIPNGK